MRPVGAKGTQPVHQDALGRYVPEVIRKYGTAPPTGGAVSAARLLSRQRRRAMITFDVAPEMGGIGALAAAQLRLAGTLIHIASWGGLL
jgi:hypothetical protein